MPRKKDDQKRKKILDSATKVFARNGFANTKIQDVANECGIAHGTIYLYFKSKDELFMSIFQDNLSELISYINSEVEKEENAEKKFRKMISLQLDIIESNPDLTKLILIEFPRTGNFLNDRNIDVLSDYIDMIINILRVGIEQKIFSIDIKTEITATIIYAGVQGLATRWLLDGMSYQLKDIEKQIADFFLEGLKHPNNNKTNK
jgi:TetR/AcrR family fatty acid metabolism transcriptional regulator